MKDEEAWYDCRGDSVMVWGCFICTEIVDRAKIDSTSKKNAVNIRVVLNWKNFVFAHDNDIKHRARICEDCMSSQAEEKVL